LNRLLDGLFQDNKVMASLAIFRNGQPVFQKSTGYSRIDEQEKLPANDQTIYRIGSISKMFTTVMVLQMAEEGKLSLKHTLSQYYPQIPNAQKITIEQLLRHRSGLSDIKSIPDFTNWVQQPKTKQQILETISRGKISFEPDTKYEYNNSEFILLSYILEKISGKSYEELLNDRITSRIGLKNTYFASTRNTRSHESHSYSYDEGWKLTTETDFSIPSGSGGIMSTPADLCTFISALFANKLLQPTSLKQMLTMEDGHGIGMFEFTFDRQTACGHNGNMDGFFSCVLYFPSSTIALAYTANGQTESLDEVIQEIVETMFVR
jgi:D-alanyl-D-alanine carboxypeptidase